MGIREFKAEMDNKIRNLGVSERRSLEKYTIRLSSRVASRFKFFCFLWIYYQQSSSSFSTIAKCHYREIRLHALRDNLLQIWLGLNLLQTQVIRSESRMRMGWSRKQILMMQI
jgi:hypothetical protein